MPVHFKLEGLKQNRWTEHAVRFALGGLATVLAGVAAKLGGPATGGLFLAFPAIFCASATLIEKHERKRKEEKGLPGKRRGQEAAALDSAGAAWGSLALGIFGLVIWLMAGAGAVVSLLAACAAWLVVAVSGWWLRRFLRHTRRGGASPHPGVASGRELPNGKVRR
ncbi:MAG: hypothetical protein ACM3OF_10905 [Gemmatimonas sp.]|jgi:hypothetical protein